MKPQQLGLLLLSILTLCLSSASFAGETRDGVLHLTAPEVQQALQDDPTIQVLDVRTPEEFAEGHFDGALNINYRDDDFKAQISELDPDKTYLVHCRSGGRSGKALDLLKSAGVKNLIHLDGGTTAWNKAGMSLGNSTR